MKKRFGLAFTICALAIVGCGGDGGGASTFSSPFAGNWTGTWNSVSLSQNGTAAVTVSESGVVSGTTTNATLGIPGTLAGTINSTRAFNGTVTLTGRPSNSLVGTVAFDAGGPDVICTFTQNVSGVNHDVTLNLSPAP